MLRQDSYYCFNLHSEFLNEFHFQAFEDGYLSAIYTPEGGTAEVGATVAVLVDSVSEVGKSGDNKPTASAASSTTATVAVSTPSSTAPASSISSDKFEKVDMPALSSTMKEGRIVSWSKKIGDKVSVGDVLLVVESDKADMDVEAYEDGYLAVITVAESQSAEVGAPVGYLAKKKEDIEAVQQLIAGGGQSVSASTASESVPASATTAPSAAVQQAAPAAVVNDGRVAASGYAKTVAKEKGIDLSTVTPSRADQYITSRDLATGNAAPAAAYVPAAGVISATPTAKKLAAENNLDVTKIKGTGNFGRVTPDDVLRAAGKLAPPAPKAAPAAPPAPAAQTPPAAAGKSKEGDSKAVLDGVKPMDGMQKAVAKNMEKTLSVPIFRVSRFLPFFHQLPISAVDILVD